MFCFERLCHFFRLFWVSGRFVFRYSQTNGLVFAGKKDSMHAG